MVAEDLLSGPAAPVVGDGRRGLVSEAKSVLREMKSAGVVLDAESGVQDDYARLVTTDPAVAERFGFDG